MKSSHTNFNLVSFMMTDMARQPMRVLLFVCVLLSATAVILSAHHNRQMAIALDRLMQQKDQLDVEWRHLVLEQSALAEHNRIENMVKKQLQMHRPTPAEEVVVRVK